LSCPRCRSELRAVEGSAGLFYRCLSGHGFSAKSLLNEQSKLATQILGTVEACLESQLSLSGELASRAQVDGQRHLLGYLERVIDVSRDTLGFVQSQMHDGGDATE
jgi:hypothetical protein